MDILKAENISFTYPEQKERVIKNVSFSIKQGEFVVIFGESGSGKSTLLRLLKRELTPHGKKEGVIYYKNRRLDELDDDTSAREIGFVMQQPEVQIVTDKVWHELAFGLENLGEPTDVIRRRVGEIANFFGIHHWFHKHTMELSGGQKQLLNLASAMVMQPEVLILDEPTSQLDPIAAEEFIDILHKLNRDLGLTIVLVEHDLEKVFPIADRVLLLESGNIILEAKPEEIGGKLKRLNDTHNMLQALPTVVRIFNELSDQPISPLTVKEGKRFITEHFNDHIVRLETSETSANDETPILEAKNLWFRYERNRPDILRGVNVSVNKGEIVTILGGNGSGKTTLLKVLSGQRRAYRGNVVLKGKKLTKYKQSALYKQLIALLPQDVQTIFLKSTVKEDYAEIGKVMNGTKEALEQSIRKIANLLSIEHLLEKHPYDLSGGEQQIVALGKLLLLEPEIIFLDEPTKGVDAYSKLKLRDLFMDLKAQGKTMVVVTHDVEFAALISDRCGLFFDGEIVSTGKPKEFFANNNFYTTIANRISRHQYEGCVTAEDVIDICKLNGVKKHEQNIH